MDLVDFKLRSRLKRKENNKFFRRFRKSDSKKLDKSVHLLHEKEFDCIDCLQCANCCTTTGPLFTDNDINRISKHLKIKPSVFTQKYLKIDEESDYVLRSVPCTFLLEDNACSIYEVRPKACREYPHTDRIRQYQLFDITQKNVEICPAVFNIVEALKKEYK